MPTHDFDHLLTTHQAAERLGVSRDTLSMWRWKGQYLPFIKVGRRAMYREADVEAFIASRTIVPVRDGRYL